MSLGLTYAKLAAQAEEPDSHAQGWEQRVGMGQPTYTPSGLPSTGGTSNYGQFGSALLGDITGADPALIQSLLPIVRLVSPGLGNWLMEMRRFGPGPGTTAESQQVSTALRDANTSLMRRTSERTSQIITGLAQRLGPESPEWLRNGVGMLAGMIQTNSDIAGPLVGALRQVPVIGPILNQFMGDVPTSYAPLVAAVYQDGNGAFDENQLFSKVAEFEKNYKDGIYTNKAGEPLSVDMAMGSFGLASQTLGNSGTAEQRADLARITNTLMEHGLAASPAMAYEMMRRMGPSEILKDPVAFDGRMARLGQQLKAVAPEKGVPSLVMGAIEASAKGGMPLEHALQNTAVAAQQRQAWEQSGAFGKNMGTLDSLALAKQQAETQGAAEADSMKSLTAWAMGSQAGKQTLLKFQENPTPELAQQMFQAARADRTAWNERHIYNPQLLLQNVTPEQRQALNWGEQMFSAPDYQPGKNPQISNVFKNPEKYQDLFVDPTKMSPASQKMFASMPLYAKEHLMNPAVRAMALDRIASKRVSNEPLPPPTTKPYVPVADIKPEPVVKPVPTPVPDARTTATS